MKSEDLYKQLSEGIEQCTTSEKYLQYLRVMSKFHKYSLTNTLCIAAQCPTATLVAGLKSWETKFSRRVRKGEKAIYIFAPLRYKDEEDKEGESSYIIKGFKPVPVFDISQTEGEPLHNLANPLTADVQDFSRIKSRLLHLAGVPVKSLEETATAYGSYNHITDTISVKDSLSESQYIKTLVHEIAHSRLHKNTDATRASKEVEAESVAFIFCQYLNLDSSSYSFEYITSWSAGSTDILKGSFKVIYTTAKQLIKEYEGIRE